LRVVRHAVALVAGPHHLPDAALLVPAAPDVPGNVAEEQEAALLVPERPLCEDEAGAQPLDLGIALDEVVQLLGFGVYGHTISPTSAAAPPLRSVCEASIPLRMPGSRYAFGFTIESRMNPRAESKASSRAISSWAK